MTKEIKNNIASIMFRINRIAKQENRDFNALILLYMQEKVLLRISFSSYTSNFLLKGGLLLFSLFGMKSRPTQDTDFLGRGVINTEENLKKVFTEILQIEIMDCLNFETDSISVETITEDADYQGKRVKFYCSLGTIRRVIQIDIGFSDVVVPKPQVIGFPVLLTDDPIPKITCYSQESAIAEKFEAMVKLSVLNSRMKDFFDIYTLATKQSYNGRLLQQAIVETFNRRGTPFKNIPIVFTDDFQSDRSKSTLWTNFVKRKIDRPDLIELQLSDVLEVIKRFLKPIWEATVKEKIFIGYWNPDGQAWILNYTETQTGETC